MKRIWPLAIAIAYVLVGVLAISLVPLPDVNASSSNLLQYYKTNEAGIRIVTWLGVLSNWPFAILIALVSARLQGPEKGLFLLGGASYMAEQLIASWFQAGLAFHSGSLNQEIMQRLVYIAAFFGPSLTIPISLMSAAVAVASWQKLGGLPRWLVWPSLVLAIEQLIETITMLGSSGFLAPGGAMNFELGGPLTMMWIVSCGAALINGTPRSQA